jgi:hypothetical protein
MGRSSSMAAEAEGERAKAARWSRGMTPDRIVEPQVRATKLFAEDFKDEGRGPFLGHPDLPGAARRRKTVELARVAQYGAGLRMTGEQGT